MAGQKRKSYCDSGPQALSTSKEFPDASYHRPAAGQTLSITDQPDKMRTVLSYTVRQAIRHAVSKSTYIEITKSHSILCKIFVNTACSLGQSTFADHMKADVMFQKDVTVIGPWDGHAYACSCTEISSGTGHGLLTDDC